MNLKAISILVACAMALVLVWFFPMWWLAKRYIKTHPDSIYARPVTKESVGYQSIFVVILFAGFASQYYAPNSVIGGLVTTGTGMLLFTLDVIALQYIVGRILVVTSRRKLEATIRNAMNRQPVLPWNGGQIIDESVPSEQAFSIELFNDDVTSMEFVVGVLQACFGMSVQSSFTTVLDIHKGSVCKLGRMTHDRATQLVEHVKQQAAKYNFPFRCEVVPFG